MHVDTCMEDEPPPSKLELMDMTRTKLPEMGNRGIFRKGGKGGKGVNYGSF